MELHITSKTLAVVRIAMGDTYTTGLGRNVAPIKMQSSDTDIISIATLK
jgi:hypothetical protein